MTKRYKLVLIVRFFGYLLFLTGAAGLIFFLGPLGEVEFSYRLDKAKGVKRTVKAETAQVNGGGEITFGEIDANTEVITPVDTNFSIVIEKINANARVVADVNPSSEVEYVNALQYGVAHAAGTNYPGEKGNVYLFSHSTDAPWNIVRYNAIFYLLRELEVGDRVIIFYKDKRYDYVVFDKKVVESDDVEYLTTKYDVPVLTLQTCDPPGTLLKRLIVRAKLQGS